MHSTSPAAPSPASTRIYAGRVGGALGNAIRSGAGDPQPWVSALQSSGAARDAAVADLHELLLRGAHFELRRRRAGVSHIPAGELEDLAVQAADDAMVAILAKLHTFRGESRFTT